MTSTLVSRFEGLRAGDYVIDPSHSEVGFTVRHLMSRVRGQFREFEGTITIGDDVLESSTRAVVDLASVETGNAERDRQLRSDDFFSVDAFPRMTFRSTTVREVDGDVVAAGELTIKDVTKEVEFAVDFLGAGPDPWAGHRVGFAATTTVSRQEWGIDFNVPLDGGRLMIGDKVTIVLAVEAVHTSPPG